MTRRDLLWLAAAAPLSAINTKPLRGIFIIAATPYSNDKAVDYEDLAREVDFLERCGVHGIVWPQVASEYHALNKDERLRGMEVLAKAAKGKKAALVLGIQGPDTATALEYAKRAEELQPDAVISTPPGNAKSAADVRDYFATLAGTVQRPFIMQTTGGAKGIVVPVEMIAGLAKEFPNLAYVKEEQEPLIPRMTSLLKEKPQIKAVFSGNAGRNLLHEMFMGIDGNMPGAGFADIYAQIWDLWTSGRKVQAREMFGRLLLAITLNQNVQGLIPYVMKKRGVFKTSMSRLKNPEHTPAQIEEIEFHIEALKPYFRV